MARPRICPECGHVFKSKSWEGMDAQWRAKHERTTPYEEFWNTLCLEHSR